MSSDLEHSPTVDAAEVARFSALAATWWDPRGKMAPLHKLNPVRLGYIRDAACQQFGRNRCGRVEQVLVEGASRTDAALLRGRTRRNTTVNFTGTSTPGSLVEVRIDDATSTTLRGQELAAVAA